MLRRILIANRGEIAVRVIRACREAGIESVAVYSDADARALHASVADYAVRIGPAGPAASYLSVEAILAAARETEAPTPSIRATASSRRTPHLRAPAKRRASSSSVRLRTPSSEWARRSPRARSPIAPRCRSCLATCRPINPTPRSRARRARSGLPILLKPSAGGGGIGMKVVRDEAALIPAIAQARREAAAAFGDDTLYVERLGRTPAARRDPGNGRRPRTRRPPVRTRVLDSAAPPEDRGGDRRRRR